MPAVYPSNKMGLLGSWKLEQDDTLVAWHPLFKIGRASCRERVSDRV